MYFLRFQKIFNVLLFNVVSNLDFYTVSYVFWGISKIILNANFEKESGETRTLRRRIYYEWLTLAKSANVSKICRPLDKRGVGGLGPKW